MRTAEGRIVANKFNLLERHSSNLFAIRKPCVNYRCVSSVRERDKQVWSVGCGDDGKDRRICKERSNT